MQRLLVLGAGTAGTMVVNKLHKRLGQEWQITIVDPATEHHYQPGYLFIPFGTYDAQDVVRPVADLLPDGVERISAAVDRVDAPASNVHLDDGTVLAYDQLVIATGTSPRPDQTPGMDGTEWRHSIFDFYTLDGAVALRDALAAFSGGNLVVHVTEMPVKCPVAALEFAFLVDADLRNRGVRSATRLTYVTPLDGAFTKPVAAAHLGALLGTRDIKLESDFMIERIDDEARTLVSYDERVVPFDLLVTVPVNMGADFVARSGLGDELNYVRVDKHTLQSTQFDNIWALGDAADLPTSKAGSVAHFSVDVFVHNFEHHIAGEPLSESFDGHTNCFVETGNNRALLLDFNYETEPLPGKYPLPYVGPFSLLEESGINHHGKQLFRWAYWNLLLPGRPMPLPARMTRAGKRFTPSKIAQTQEVH